MNFFEHQDQARKQTWWLIFLFALAVIAIVAVMDLLMLFLLGSASSGQATTTHNLLSSNNVSILLGTSAVTLGIILLSSLYRIASLRSGGSTVATELGGVLVNADVRDPLRRRLRNVVEEIALAAGVPVPTIYVMEQEPGINAFAAGYSPADAAIAVTRGTLEKLNREELQGVIAHEFSHIINGDMRINIRLMGVIFGILMMSVIGRHLMMASSSHRHSYSSNNKNGGGMMMVALGVMVIGYVGLFFGNLIKAAVSRKREYLADASAVQFTRNPQGIAGALKRIAVDGKETEFSVDTTEVSHMLFSGNALSSLMATHPPLIDRIQRIEPGFNERELASIARRSQRAAAFTEQENEAAERRTSAAEKPTHAFDGILGNIGNPTQQQMLYAALLSSSFPDAIQQAAHSPDWAPEILCLVLLDNDPDIREQQLLTIASKLGPDSERQCRYLANELPRVEPGQRLPLATLSLPALKRRPREDLLALHQTIAELTIADGKTSLFEYAIGCMLRAQIQDALDPADVQVHGSKRLSGLRRYAVALLHTVASVGHQDPATVLAARDAGLARAGLKHQGPSPIDGNWMEVLDQTLKPLNQLTPGAKEMLVSGLFATVTHDHQVTLEETEILRAICAALHVPLPLMQADQALAQ